MDAAITLVVLSTGLTQRACQLVKMSYFPGMQHRFHPSLVNERSNTTLCSHLLWFLLWYNSVTMFHESTIIINYVDKLIINFLD